LALCPSIPQFVVCSDGAFYMIIRLWILEFRKSFRFRDFKSIRSKIRSSMFVEFGGKGER
jgi:hypothetical protein